VVAAALAVAVAVPAFAVDGVIEINQAAVKAGNITPGDTPGFPATLSLPGSYRFTGNLDVRGETSPEDVTAVTVTSDNVSLDLNGFAIIGPVTCTVNPTNCTPAGQGSGVDTSNTNITVRNGTIRGMGQYGVRSLGQDARVEALQSIENRAIGIFLFLGGRAERCEASRNGGDGIRMMAGAIAVANEVAQNGVDGIVAPSALILGNRISANTTIGLSTTSTTGYGNNVFIGNGTNVGGGPKQIPAGSNVCDAVICP
jgi:hypothetical protein